MVALLGLTLAVGCGGVEILVKMPVAEGCRKIPLKECDAAADAVVMYIQGDKAGAQDRIAVTVSANSPAELKLLAEVVQTVGTLPGVEEHAGPIIEVADMIANGARAKAHADKTAGATRAAGATDPAGRGQERGISADSDLLRLTGGTTAPITSPGLGPCGPLLEADATTCVRVATGPLVITDIHATPGCDASVFVAAGLTVGTGKGPRWAIVVAPHMTGARLLVRKDESLLIGSADGASTGQRCTVTWSGFRPYYSEE